MKKLLILTFLLAALLFALLACNQSNREDVFAELMRPTGENESEIPPFAAKVYLIIPEYSSGNLAERASLLADNINKRTGVEVYLKYDNEITVVAEDELEILVGYTKRLASSEAMKHLKFEDYICRWERNVILLGGRYEDATIAAIEAFEENVLHGASSASLMGADVKIENIKDYDAESVKLNGYDLYDFTITYSDKNSNGEYKMAYDLRSCIASKSGYWLSVASDREAEPTLGKVINISSDASMLYDAACESKNGSVALTGKDCYALSEAVADFAERLLTVDANGDAVFSLDETLIYTCDSEPVGISAVFAEYDGEPDATQIYGINEHIRKGNDITVLGSMTATLANYIFQNRIDGYEYVLLDLASDRKLPIVYRRASVKNAEISIADNILSVSFTHAESSESYTLLYALKGSDRKAIESLLQYDKYEILIMTDSSQAFANENMLLLGDFEWKLNSQSHSVQVLTDVNLMSDGGVNTEQKQEENFVTVFSSFSVKEKYSDKYIALCKTLE